MVLTAPGRCVRGASRPSQLVPEGRRPARAHPSPLLLHGHHPGPKLLGRDGRGAHVRVPVPGLGCHLQRTALIVRQLIQQDAGDSAKQGPDVEGSLDGFVHGVRGPQLRGREHIAEQGRAASGAADQPCVTASGRVLDQKTTVQQVAGLHHRVGPVADRRVDAALRHNHEPHSSARDGRSGRQEQAGHPHGHRAPELEHDDGAFGRVIDGMTQCKAGSREQTARRCVVIGGPAVSAGQGQRLCQLGRAALDTQPYAVTQPLPPVDDARESLGDVGSRDSTHDRQRSPFDALHRWRKRPSDGDGTKHRGEVHRPSPGRQP